jgi:hypothetical protein
LREAVEELVLGAEHDRRAQDHRPGKRLQHRGLAQRLAIRIVTLAVFVRADGRDMHQRSDALLGGHPGNAGGAVMLHEAEGVLAAFGEDADAVHDRIGAMDRGAHAVVVTDIGEDRLHLTDRAVGAHEDRFVRAADGDADAPTLLGHAARDIAADKARSAKYRDEFRHARDPPDGTFRA